MLAGTLGEVATADTAGEAEVVFDAGGPTGLSAHGVAFDECDREPFGRGVDGCGEPGRAGTVDRQVVFGGSRFADPAKVTGNLVDGGLDDDGSVGEGAHRPPVSPVGVLVDRRGGGGVDEVVVHDAARQEVAQFVGVGVRSGPVEREALFAVGHEMSVEEVAVVSKRRPSMRPCR